MFSTNHASYEVCALLPLLCICLVCVAACSKIDHRWSLIHPFFFLGRTKYFELYFSCKRNQCRLSETFEYRRYGTIYHYTKYTDTTRFLKSKSNFEFRCRTGGAKSDPQPKKGMPKGGQEDKKGTRLEEKYSLRLFLRSTLCWSGVLTPLY